MPRQLASLGDRLVFSNGIISLSIGAGALLIIFGGSVSRLIPLYAVGVFTSFTLSQAGMVVHWWKERSPGWKLKSLINGFGSLVTLIVTFVLLFSKFHQGAWLIVITVPLLVFLFSAINKHYKHVAKRLRIATDVKLHLPIAPSGGTSPVIVLVGQLHRGSFEAVRYARSIATELVAVHVDLGNGKAEIFKHQWQKQLPDIPLMVLESPYRSLINPVIEFVEDFENQHRKGANLFCTVVLPVFVTRHRWEALLHNHSTYFLRSALRAKGTRIITTVGFYL
jgi:ABC-type multidrug transport system fused ATPase/permease subunit